MKRPEMVRPEYCALEGESWEQYLRRVFPDLADILLIADPATRAREITEAEERLWFARQSYDYCRGLPSWPEAVEQFLAQLGGEHD